MSQSSSDSECCYNCGEALHHNAEQCDSCCETFCEDCTIQDENCILFCHGCFDYIESEAEKNKK